MESPQIIYPTTRLLANPKVFIAIANYFDGPDWETFAHAFYDLIESQFLEDDSVEPDLNVCPEVCFREKPEDPDTYQVILSNGEAIELRPDGDDTWSLISTEEDLGVVSAIYGRIVKAIEEKRPDLADDVALTNMPTESNSFLRSGDGDAFRGTFHLKSDPEKVFDFVVNIIDLEDDDLRAEVTAR
jgi:hypothetical protein